MYTCKNCKCKNVYIYMIYLCIYIYIYIYRNYMIFIIKDNIYITYAWQTI